MKQQLQQLRQRTIELLKNPDISDASILAQLAVIPAKLQQLEAQVDQIHSEIMCIQKQLETFAANNPIGSAIMHPQILHKSNGSISRGRQTNIRIQIDRQKLGLPGGVETISEHSAADSFVKLLLRLYQAKGVGVLNRLTELRVSRGNLVSNNPDKDFSYQSRSGRAIYQHQAIADSGLFLLTTSTTEQKVADIRKVCQFLDLPDGSVQAEQADKFAGMEEYV